MLPTSSDPTAKTSGADPALPERIGRYVIQEQLGAGGMGTVYKAHDPQLDRVVALKMPHFGLSPASLSARVQRFQREARAAAGIWHPHVCPIYDVGEQDGQPYVVMAYVEGESLAQKLAREVRFADAAQAVRVVRQVLEALEAVHARGIVHRDLKAANIMIDSAGRAILMDFGLARPENDAEHLTSDGVILGTPSTMAPEQAAGQSDRVGPWTDLYSVGVVLYQALTGRLPFEGPPLTVLARIMHDDPPRPSNFQPDLDPALEAIILRAMAREPAARYQSAREFIGALDAWLAGRGLSAAPGAETIRALPAGPKGGGGWGAQGMATEMVRETPPVTSLTSPPAARMPAKRGRGMWLGCALAALLIVPCGASVLIKGCGGVVTTRKASSTSGVGYSTPGVGYSTPPSKPKTTIKIVSPSTGRADLIPKLFEALAKGQRVYVQELLSQGADPNAKDKDGETPFMKVAARGDLAMLHVLCQPNWGKGIRVNDKDNKGESALMKAAENNQIEFIRALLGPRNNGTVESNLGEVEVNEEDNKGQTALAKAKAKKYQEIVEALKKAGARE